MPVKRSERNRLEYISERAGEWYASGENPFDESARLTWESGYSSGYQNGVSFQHQMLLITTWISIAAIIISAISTGMMFI
jgi:hypothetical protein